MSAVAPVKHRIEDRGPGGPAAWLRRWEALLLALLLLVLLVGGATQKNFLDPYNLADSTFNFSEKALIALPIALLIIVREIDISVAGILAVSSVAMGWASQHGVNARRMTENGKSMIGSGYYLDQMRRENGRWRFVVRDMHFIHWVPIQEGWASQGS